MQIQREKAPCLMRSRGNDTCQQRARRVSMQTRREKAPCLIAKLWQWHPPAKSVRSVHANSTGKRIPV